MRGRRYSLHSMWGQLGDGDLLSQISGVMEKRGRVGVARGR